MIKQKFKKGKDGIIGIYCEFNLQEISAILDGLNKFLLVGFFRKLSQGKDKERTEKLIHKFQNMKNKLEKDIKKEKVRKIKKNSSSRSFWRW